MPRVASSGFKLAIFACVAITFGGVSAVAQPKAGGAQPVAASSSQPSTAGACYACYGLNPAQKVKICSDVIDSGMVKGLGLGLAYFNRAQALSRPQRRLIHRHGDVAPTIAAGLCVGWAAFDLDKSLPPDAIDWRTHPREAAFAIVQRDLPTWAIEADLVVYWSASQGFNATKS